MWEVPVWYDGPDLTAVAEAVGVAPEEVARVHAACVWTVQFLGFLPGFGYLESDEWPWELPRRATPRASVPALAVAVAGRRSGIYPDRSPGGWNLLGRVLPPVFDRERGAILRPGNRVVFRRVDP